MGVFVVIIIILVVVGLRTMLSFRGIRYAQYLIRKGASVCYSVPLRISSFYFNH